MSREVEPTVWNAVAMLRHPAAWLPDSKDSSYLLSAIRYHGGHSKTSTAGWSRDDDAKRCCCTKGWIARHAQPIFCKKKCNGQVYA